MNLTIAVSYDSNS